MLFLKEVHGRGMDYAIAYFEVQEPLAKVSGNRRRAGIQEYSSNAGPKTSLVQVQIICTQLNQQHLQNGITQHQQLFQGSHHRARKETASAKAMVQSQRSVSILNFLSGRGVGWGSAMKIQRAALQCGTPS